jgi:hypothetical protein
MHIIVKDVEIDEDFGTKVYWLAMKEQLRHTISLKFPYHHLGSQAFVSMESPF